MNDIRFHAIANIFPMMSENEYLELLADIEKNGQREAIWLHPDGSILDGRNRYKACVELKITPKYRTWDELDSLVAFVTSLNLHRRHLTSSQRAAVAVAALPFYEEEAKGRQGQRTDLEANITEKFPESEKGESRQKAAQEFGTNERYVSDAKKLAEKSPELFEAVKAGEITIPKAKEKTEFFTPDINRIQARANNEYHTPEKYLDAVKSVLGKIDLDPASNLNANIWVEASKFFTKEDDGLLQDWRGKVWLNPPYGGDAGKFAAKLVKEYEAKKVTEAILLVNSNSTDTRWFQPLWDYVLCFTNHRIDFEVKQGNGGGSTHGSVFVYLGNKKLTFKQEFSKFGAVVHRV